MREHLCERAQPKAELTMREHLCERAQPKAELTKREHLCERAQPKAELTNSSCDTAVEQLRDLLGNKLCSPEEVKAPEGVPTGNEELDRFLFWHGLPKGALTLLSGAIGTGATCLWIEAAARTVNAGKWVAWINNEIPLSPLPLSQKGVNLGHFVSIQPDVSSDRAACSSAQIEPVGGNVSRNNRASEKERSARLFFILQELLSSTLFELVGCDLGDQQLKEHQLRKLQAQARMANVALVFISQNSNVARVVSADVSAPLSGNRRHAPLYSGSAASVFSLIIQIEKKQITIERCLHRQTPHKFPRSLSYARFTNFSNSAEPSAISNSGDRSLGASLGGLQQIKHA
jgi:hypothetical protein